jgi:uncharacterized DUF497 family protein
MKIEFHPAKDLLNRKRHGLPLALAAELEWKPAFGNQKRGDRLC